MLAVLTIICWGIYRTSDHHKSNPVDVDKKALTMVIGAFFIVKCGAANDIFWSWRHALQNSVYGSGPQTLARGPNLACGAFSSGPHGRVNKKWAQIS